jgi:hypothetical protein
MKIRSIVAALGLSLSLVAAARALEFDTVMVSGRPDGDLLGPQLGTAIEWRSVDQAVINSQGQVAFQGRLLSTQGGVTSATDRGIWRWESGSKELITREGSQAPGLASGITTDSLIVSNTICIDDAGSVYFRSALGGTATATNNDTMTVVTNNGVATIVAREGSPTTSLAPVPYGDTLSTRADGPGLTASGKMVYLGSLAAFPGVNTTNDRALWYGDPSNPVLLAREGDVLPAYGASAIIGSFNSRFAAGDQVVYSANIVNGSTTEVLFGGSQGSISEMAKAGDVAPGSGGQAFSGFLDSKINAPADVTFGTFLSDNTEALYLNHASSFSVLARSGNPAPGTGEAFQKPVGTQPRYPNILTTSGHVAFYSDLAPSGGVNSANNSGIWIHESGSTRLAVREGNPAPGMSGVSIGEILQFTMNDNQDVIFVSSLVGAVTPGIDDRALCRVDAAGNLSKLLQRGDLFDVDPSAATDLRTISVLSLEGQLAVLDAHAAVEYSFNDQGRLLFSLDFTNGTNGLFTTSVPEPAALTLVLLGILAWGARRVRA